MSPEAVLGFGTAHVGALALGVGVTALSDWGDPSLGRPGVAPELWRVVLGTCGTLLAFFGVTLWIGYLELWLQATRRGPLAELYKAGVLAFVPAGAVTLVVLLVFDRGELERLYASTVPVLPVEWVLLGTAFGVICLLAFAWQGYWQGREP